MSYGRTSRADRAPLLEPHHPPSWDDCVSAPEPLWRARNRDGSVPIAGPHDAPGPAWPIRVRMEAWTRWQRLDGDSLGARDERPSGSGTAASWGGAEPPAPRTSGTGVDAAQRNPKIEERKVPLGRGHYTQEARRRMS